MLKDKEIHFIKFEKGCKKRSKLKLDRGKLSSGKLISAGMQFEVAASIFGAQLEELAHWHVLPSEALFAGKNMIHGTN